MRDLQVLFEAPSASDAYDKGSAWAAQHAAGNTFQFVGIEHINELLDAPGDGIEVDGEFVEISNVWQRRDELTPAKADLRAIMLERNAEKPVGELKTEEQKRKAKRILGEERARGENGNGDGLRA